MQLIKQLISSKMYPVTSHHLLKPVSDETSSVKSLLRLSNKNIKPSPVTTATTLTTKQAESITKVIAVIDIPRGTCSEDISVAHLTQDETSIPQNIAVCVSEEGKLRATACDSKWLLEARLAGDCHSYNVVLQRGGASDTVILHVVRTIRRGEELQLWFSEQMLVALAVPFLTPLNIQGEKRYVCHRCGRHFEIPNPLKIHLALDCGRLHKFHLWKRLRRHFSNKQEDNSTREQHRASSDPIQSISSLAHTTTYTPPAFEFKFELVSKDDRTNYSGPQDLSATTNTVRVPNTATSSSVIKNEDLQIVPNQESHNVRQSTRSISEPLNIRGSAFKPYWSKRIDSASADSVRTNNDSERSTSGNILPNSRSPLLSQPRFFFHPPSHLSGTSLQRQKSSSITGLISANSLLVPRSYNKQDVLPPSNFHQQSSIATTAGFSHAAEMETLVSNLGRSKRGHLCIYCGKIYSRKYGLKIHIRTHTGYKPLKCKFCLRPFGDPSNLNKHVRLHAEGDTPYKCDLCGKILVRRRDLERHVKSRHSPHLDTEQHQEINKNNTS